MADEPLQSEEVPTLDEPPAEQRTAPTAWNVVGVVVLLVVLLLIVLLLKDCGGEPGKAQGGGDKTIVAVPRYEPLPGVVSVWVSKDTTISKVLATASVRSEDVVSLAGGRYVVVVSVGDEQLMVDTLKAQKGVFDAGLVYDEGSPKQ